MRHVSKFVPLLIPKSNFGKGRFLTYVAIIHCQMLHSYLKLANPYQQSLVFSSRRNIGVVILVFGFFTFFVSLLYCMCICQEAAHYRNNPHRQVKEELWRTFPFHLAKCARISNKTSLYSHFSSPELAINSGQMQILENHLLKFLRAWNDRN